MLKNMIILFMSCAFMGYQQIFLLIVLRYINNLGALTEYGLVKQREQPFCAIFENFSKPRFLFMEQTSFVKILNISNRCYFMMLCESIFRTLTFAVYKYMALYCTLVQHYYIVIYTKLYILFVVIL